MTKAQIAPVRHGFDNAEFVILVASRVRQCIIAGASSKNLNFKAACHTHSTVVSAQEV
jgi:hypothetical protein